jgi:hypothetical protein
MVPGRTDGKPSGKETVTVTVPTMNYFFNPIFYLQAVVIYIKQIGRKNDGL